MLRHIISVSLAITACTTLIPTKANAATLTIVALDTLQKNPGDTITFAFVLNPFASNPLPPGTINRDIISYQSFFFTVDNAELSFRAIEEKPQNYIISNTSSIAEITFNVTQPVKDGNSDLFNAKVNYLDSTGTSRETSIAPQILDVEPVPEPLTMLGAAAALGYGAILKRKSSKKTVS